MAQYHYRAAQLKPLVEAANFSPAQLNLILKMMRGCTMLRQGKVIESFLECMLPENYEMRIGREIQGKYGTYRPRYIAKIGEVIDEQVLQQEFEEEA